MIVSADEMTERELLVGNMVNRCMDSRITLNAGKEGIDALVVSRHEDFLFDALHELIKRLEVVFFSTIRIEVVEFTGRDKGIIRILEEEVFIELVGFDHKEKLLHEWSDWLTFAEKYMVEYGTDVFFVCMIESVASPLSLSELCTNNSNTKIRRKCVEHCC